MFDRIGIGELHTLDAILDQTVITGCERFGNSTVNWFELPRYRMLGVVTLQFHYLRPLGGSSTFFLKLHRSTTLQRQHSGVRALHT